MTKRLKMSNLIINNAQIEDVPALVKLLNVLFSIEQDFHPDALRQTAGLSLIIQNPDSAIIKVARNQTGHVIGMVSAQLVISTSQGSTSAWIEDMVVSDQYRAQGIGRQLLTSVLQWAKDKGATRAQLLVDLDNEAALGYYEHLGWQASRMGMRRLILK
jgi:GNAT superfamily N-acetyltransferase